VATSTTNENEENNNNIMMDKSMKRIQTIMTLLGPAVHPSEMTYRSIEPLTKGPIRGTLLSVPSEQQCNNTTMKVVTNILSKDNNQSSTSRNQFSSGGGGISTLLESGRSRLIQNNSSSHNNNALTSTFLDTMNIIYNDNENGNNDKENTQLQSQMIWNKHVNNLPMPKSIYLKHDSEDDLDKIHALKSLRMRNSSTNFATDMERTICKPKQLGTLKSVGNTGQRSTGLQLVGKSGSISAKPSFDMTLFCSSKPIKKKEDFASRLNSTVPFTKFLDDDNDNTKETDSVSVVSLPSIITLDPIFDPLHKSLPSKKLKPPINELLKPLNVMCSASSVSARLNLPGRFIKSHETVEGLSCYLLPLEKNQFDFLDSYKDSVISEEDESMLPKSMSMTSNNVQYKIPHKICPDTDIDPFQVKPKSSKPSKTIRSSILSLPSFSGMISFGKTRKSSIDVAGSQRRSVQSSSHVSNVDSLQKVMANSNKASCLFLSQIKVEKVTSHTAERRRQKLEEQKSTSNRLLSDAIRSSVPSAIQAHCSAYPVAPWFDSKKDVASSSNNISEIDIALLNLKRKTFCHNAKARSSGEGSRTLLLTGCSSRRNAEYKYSYRGLLTNQAVSARVFERRYNAMLQLNKSYDHQKDLSSSGGAKHLLNDDSFFSRMALGIFVEAFSRHKEATKKSSKARVSRSAPYAFKLNTKRHGKFQITANSNGPKSRRYVSTSKPELLISLPTIDVLTTTRKDEESLYGSVFDTIAVLGQQSLKCRGELIHLETKANELEAEQKSYLKELAVVNRGRVNTPKDVPFAESLNNETQIDWSVPDETNMKKRKAGDESATDELNNDERSDDKKKKRKKDKKKKKKRKKRKREKRKRKEEEDAASTAVQLGDESKKCKVSEDVDENEVVTTDPQEVSTREQRTIELPTMTPINLPPKKKIDLLKAKQLSLPQGGQDCTDQQPNAEQPPTTTSKLSDHSPKQPELSSTTYSTASTEKSSPDSVAHMLNPDTKPSSSSLPEHDDRYQPQQMAQEINRGDTQQQRDVMYQSQSHLTQQEVEQYHTRTLLTSESFLETFGEVVAELASGRWQKAIDNNRSDNETQTGIVVSDCPLLDIAGVDIELSDASAIIVQNLSSWGDNQTAQKGARAFLRRLVFLCASGRYNAIHVILCLDVEMSAVLSTEIVNLQNACAQQSGCPCDYVTFEYSHRPRSVAASIALRAESVSSSQESSQISEFVAEENVQERVRFLVMLIPTMSVHMACKALGFQVETGTSQLESGKALQTLFQLAKTTTKDLFPYKMEGILSSRCAEQLWMTLNVDVAQHAFQG